MRRTRARSSASRYQPDVTRNRPRPRARSRRPAGQETSRRSRACSRSMAIDVDRLERFLADPKIPKDAKDQAVAAARAEEGGSFDVGAAGRYVTGKANEFVTAGQNLLGDVLGQPSATPRGWGDTAS